MQSFVVQNFYSTTPFNIRTRRYVGIVHYESATLLLTLLKLNTFFTQRILLSNMILPPFSLQLIYTFFIKPFNILFKKLVAKSFGLYSNNITKSLSYSTIKSLVTVSALKPLGLTHNYLKPITLVNFAFHKTNYNNLVVLIMHVLTQTGLTLPSTFYLQHSYIFIPKYFSILNFCNNYYFKLHHF